MSEKINLDNFRESIIAISDDYIIGFCHICNAVHSFTREQYEQEVALFRAKDTRIANAIQNTQNPIQNGSAVTPNKPEDDPLRDLPERGFGGSAPTIKQLTELNKKMISSVKNKKNKRGREPEAVSQHKPGDDAKRSEAKRTPEEQGSAAHTSAKDQRAPSAPGGHTKNAHLQARKQVEPPTHEVGLDKTKTYERSEFPILEEEEH